MASFLIPGIPVRLADGIEESFKDSVGKAKRLEKLLGGSTCG
jgi:hypothetical protein